MTNLTASCLNCFEYFFLDLLLISHLVLSIITLNLVSVRVRPLQTPSKGLSFTRAKGFLRELVIYVFEGESGYISICNPLIFNGGFS